MPRTFLFSALFILLRDLVYTQTLLVGYRSCASASASATILKSQSSISTQQLLLLRQPTATAAATVSTTTTTTTASPSPCPTTHEQIPTGWTPPLTLRAGATPTARAQSDRPTSFLLTPPNLLPRRRLRELALLPRLRLKVAAFPRGSGERWKGLSGRRRRLSSRRSRWVARRKSASCVLFLSFGRVYCTQLLPALDFWPSNTHTPSRRSTVATNSFQRRHKYFCHFASHVFDVRARACRVAPSVRPLLLRPSFGPLGGRHLSPECARPFSH